MDDHRIAWLILHRSPGLGSVGKKRLLELFDSPEEILNCDVSDLSNYGFKQETINFFKDPDLKAIESDLNWLNQPDCYLINCKDPCYPSQLWEIADAPLLLFVRGNPELLVKPQIALVGSRNPSPAGRQIARLFSKQLASLGYVITSGLALGIDFCSHMGALDARGQTIAVLGNGLHEIYPSRHRKLAENIILGNGALVTDYPYGVPPIPKNFPRRNRIISGLSFGVVVIEAAQRSGSLITAKHALEQGREVFAVPGAIQNPLTRGCHSLIKQGAKLVESINDIVDEFRQYSINLKEINARSFPTISADLLDDDCKLLLDSIAYESVTVDELIERTGLTPEKVSSMLLILEVRGVITTCPGGLYSRTTIEINE